MGQEASNPSPLPSDSTTLLTIPHQDLFLEEYTYIQGSAFTLGDP